MRTTIEITDEQRSRLLAMAATRGMKGFSNLVQEALEEYLSKRELDQERITAALARRGALEESEAQELTANCASIRDNWR